MHILKSTYFLLHVYIQIDVNESVASTKWKAMVTSEDKANVNNQDNEPALPRILLAIKLPQREEPSIYFQSRESQESFPIITLTTNTAEIDIIQPMELELD